MFCQNCGIANTIDSNFCYSCGNSIRGTANISDIRESTNLQEVKYAGFWKRVMAFSIDYLILGTAYTILFSLSLVLLSMIYGQSQNQALGAVAIYFINIIILFIGMWLYYALMESSTRQGTVGKIAVKIKVVDKNGNKISFGRATARHFSKFTLGLTLCIGAIMTAFTKKKQGLHDMMSSCLVINKQEDTGKLGKKKNANLHLKNISVPNQAPIEFNLAPTDETSTKLNIKKELKKATVWGIGIPLVIIAIITFIIYR